MSEVVGLNFLKKCVNTMFFSIVCAYLLFKLLLCNAVLLTSNDILFLISFTKIDEFRNCTSTVEL